MRFDQRIREPIDRLVLVLVLVLAFDQAALAAPKPAPDAGVPKPPADATTRAKEIAQSIPIARRAFHDLRNAAAELTNPPLRAALEAQLQTPWLIPSTWALTHVAEAEALLHKEKLLGEGERLVLPPSGKGSFAAAPGGPCPTGHHAYPGGLAVHSWATLLRARGMAEAYAKAYDVKLDDSILVAAALWHDSLKVSTLPWDDAGSCPAQEPQLAHTALHHILGISAAITRRLPRAIVWTIASAHDAPSGEGLAKMCGYLRAAGILAKGDPESVPCPSLTAGRKPPIEAFVINAADSDYNLTVSAWASYAAATPSGWERFAALAQDGSDLLVWFRGQEQKDP